MYYCWYRVFLQPRLVGYKVRLMKEVQSLRHLCLEVCKRIVFPSMALKITDSCGGEGRMQFLCPSGHQGFPDSERAALHFQANIMLEIYLM